MNINDVLKNFNENELQQINQFINSSQGKGISNNLSQSQKEKLLKQFINLDPTKVKSKLNGLTKEDILKLLK